MNVRKSLTAALILIAAPVSTLSIAASADAKPVVKCHAIVNGKKSWTAKNCKAGPRGKAGKNGINGQNGVNGAQGAPGINGQQGTPGLNGQQGPRGADGINGKDGANGVSGYEVMTYDYIKGIGHRPGYPGMDAGYSGVGAGAPATVVCSNPNKVAIGGGYFIRDGASDRLDTNGAAMNANVIASFPGRVDWSVNSPKAGVYSGWVVRFGGTQQPDNVTLYVICISPLY